MLRVKMEDWRRVPFLTRVRIANYKSIRACDVTLGPLTILVGPNGSGKSNFLDALAFLRDAVTTSIEDAITSRGGLDEICSRSPEAVSRFGISVEALVPWGPLPHQFPKASYGVEITATHVPGERPFKVAREKLSIPWEETNTAFENLEGRATTTYGVPPSTIEPTSLYLPLAAGMPGIAPLFARLRGMAFYNFELGPLRQVAPQAVGAPLGPQGQHLGDVLADIADRRPDVIQRINEYMAAIVPDYEGIYRQFEGMYVTVELRTRTGPAGRPIGFGARAMSDGTLRSAAVLAALFQSPVLGGRIALVGIEEPELTVHPGAAGVLYDAITEASEQVQVVISSHSADLLDRDDVDIDSIRAVTSEHGRTIISSINEAGRKTLRERLFTAGELLRGGQLGPDESARRLALSQAFDVFGD